jgi:hypothetical protein
VDFQQVELVLNQKTHLVCQVRYSMPNGNRMILDFEKMEINPTPPITWESISKDLPHWDKGSNQKKQKSNSASPGGPKTERVHGGIE